MESIQGRAENITQNAKWIIGIVSDMICSNVHSALTFHFTALLLLRAYNSNHFIFLLSGRV